MADKLVIIDGNSIFYRSFYALPLLTNSQGEYSNAVYGFAVQIVNIINNIKPKYMVVAFDKSKHTFRNDIFDGYKATRKPMPDELRCQIEPLKNMLKLMNIQIAEKEGLEGDDMMGIVASMFSDLEKIIVTGDRDSFQLVDNKTSVYFTKRGTSDVKIIGPKELKEEFGVTAKQFIDLKALQGDESDNIPGVAGVGPKTAKDLIVEFGSLDGVYQNIEKINGKLKEKLLIGKDSAFMSRKLAEIVRDGSLDIALNDCEYDFPFSANVNDFFKHYDFKTLLKNDKLFDLTKGEKNSFSCKIINYSKIEELQNLVEKIKTTKQFAYFFNKKEIHFSFGDVEYVFNISDDLLGVGINDFEFFDNLKQIFEDESVLKISCNSKQDMYYLKSYGIELNGYFDLMIAKYLVDGVPVDSVYDLFFDDDLNCVSAKMFKFFVEYKNKIEEEKLQFLFYNIENTLSKVLFSMESCGFKIDLNIVNALKEKYTIESQTLEKKIYEIAGEEFNLNSPKQLAHILYDKLGLSHKKKQSTSADHLQSIENEHEIVRYILRYRKVAKFLSTYITGLIPHIDKNGFVHTYFKQTLTTTGRLSSTEPNLQNIPIRSEESKEIRSMFVASSKDHVLIDADYSQIELRLLAHFSGDSAFVEAFKKGDDIHAKTAVSIFGVDEQSVTPEMRRMAKIVNFGVIYGMSEYGLSDDLKISVRDAKVYISNYYQKHQAVDSLMKNLVEEAKLTGKASTLFGRTRKMVDINSSNFMIRSRAERAAQNMPLQGTAADIIKIAMVNTFYALKNSGLKAKLIMQVHDELIIDCPIEEQDKVCELLKHEMINACKLNVPLDVDCVTSYRWSDGH